MKPQDSFLTGLYLIKVDILNSLKKYKEALPLLEDLDVQNLRYVWF